MSKLLSASEDRKRFIHSPKVGGWRSTFDDARGIDTVLLLGYRRLMSGSRARPGEERAELECDGAVHENQDW